MTLSSQIVLVNPSNRPSKFHIHRDNTEAALIRSVYINGRPAAYEAARTGVDLVAQLGPGQDSKIEIAYKNDLNLAAIDISKSSLSVNTLRRSSDARDLWLSRSIMGRRVEYAYYHAPASSNALGIESAASFALLCVAGYMISKRVRRKRMESYHCAHPVKTVDHA